MSKHVLRLGLVGLGTWAKNGHLPVYRNARLANALRLAALCSRSIDKATYWAHEQGGVAAYDDVDAMLEREELDIVSVCTPDDRHAEYVCKALRAGCDVLVEKPLATTAEDLRRILEVQQETGRRVITLYHKRADALWAEAAQRTRSGELGALQMGWATIQNPLTVPAGAYFTSDMAQATDPNWFLGTHVYDLIRFITALNPVEARAYAYEGALKAHGLRSPDSVKVDIRMENGASVSCFLSWNLPEPAPTLTKQSMTLHFEKGELELDGLRRGFYLFGEDGYRYLNPYFMRETPAGWMGYGAQFLEEAVLCLSDPDHVSPVSLPSLEDAWWASAVGVAVQDSIKTNQTVPVQPPPQ